MNSINSPAIRYHGGKFRLAPWILAHFPAHRISGGRGTAIRTECIWINPACQRARPAVQLAMDLARA